MINMKKPLILLLILSIMFIYGCGNMNLLGVVQANKQIKEFMQEYPNAEMKMVRISEKNIAAENERAKELCGIELEEKAHYVITIKDSDSGMEVYAYMDAEEQEIICIRKMGKQTEQDAEEKQEKPKETEKVMEQMKDKDETEKKEQEQEKEHVKEKEEIKKQETEECSQETGLDYEITEGKLQLKWTKSECAGFKGYKVVWSDENENPKYPEDSYIGYITDIEQNSFEEKQRAKDGYYGVTILTSAGNLYSNPVYVEGTGEAADEITIGYDLELEYELEDGKLEIKWNPYEGESFQYYKVVWSKTNDNLMYPDDGYISVVSDKSSSDYIVPEEKYTNGTNYYRITAIFGGFKSGDDSGRINSNVITLVKGSADPTEE